MMAPAYEENPVQAFPIHAETFMGTASGVSCVNKSVIHCVEDGSVTFYFKTTGTKTFTVTAGMDFGITRDVTTIDSSNQVWIS
jgi:hypothetical protein